MDSERLVADSESLSCTDATAFSGKAEMWDKESIEAMNALA